VARGLIPNTQRSYDRLGEMLNKARLAGLVDWNAIIDRTRSLEHQSSWGSVGDIIKSCANGFTLDLWADQDYIVEVWIEKQALIGVIQPVCDELFVPYFGCKGYVSQSEQWRAGRRILRRYKDTGKETIIIHLGDHDPSGIDMTRDNDRRLQMFSEDNCTVERIALNMDQVQHYCPPPNPTKMTDSRSPDYVKKYGHYCWELDALEPSVIADLIRDEVDQWRDIDKFDAREELSSKGRDKLQKIAKIIT